VEAWEWGPTPPTCSPHVWDTWGTLVATLEGIHLALDTLLDTDRNGV